MLRPRLEQLEERTLLSVAYVDDSATGLNTGTDWANAYTSLQSALQATPAPAQEIRVGQGTYKPTLGADRTVSFALRNGVSIYGGYAGFGATNPDSRNTALYPSILSGDIGAAESTADNSYHVVVGNSLNATAVLDGFTITAGNANGTSSSDSGGGMCNSASSSPTITNCTFTANSAKYEGGGMYNSSWSSPRLTNCAFTANSASYGGGIYNFSSSPTLINCAFIANSASEGGGMRNSSSSPTLTNCTFTANSANNSGGGLYNFALSPKLTNCVVWGNTATNGSQISGGSTPVVTYCDVQGGYDGIGNINADPQFIRNPGPGPDGQWGTVDDDFGDLRLRLASSCIDAGNNSAVPSGVTTDLAGNPRQTGIPASPDTGIGTAPIVDMGAYEAVAAVQVFPGGPYHVLEGRSVVLSGVGYSPNALSISYAWDFDGDGQYDDATGPSPVFSAIGRAGPQTVAIALRVTDTAGLSGNNIAVLHIERPLYVDDSAMGLNDGSSWGNAYTNLQSALTVAVSGQTIVVGQGTYKPTTGTDRTATFQLRTGVSIYGGYAGFGAADPDARNVVLYSSILSGDIGAAGNTADNSYHVVVASGTNAAAVLDGFTVSAGNANGNSPCDQGGGLYSSGGSPTLANCIFTANSATSMYSGGGGGGMYNSGGSPTLVNCTFLANSVTGTSGEYCGGGMYNKSSSPTLTKCIFAANSATSGGGMYNDGSLPLLTDCTFVANSATSTFIGGNGGGMYNNSSSLTLTNCTFAANRASNTGGGMYNYWSSSQKLTNCILWGNTADNDRQIINYGNTPVVTYCDIEEGYSGTGNINADPQFVRNPGPGPDGQWFTADDDYGDLRLRPWSPAVDSGNNAALPAGISTDLAGNPRFADVPTTVDSGIGAQPIVDMGAYEVVAALAVEAGGPYAVLEGRQVTLQGYGASAKAGTLLYEWDFDGDGQYDDAVGPTPTFSAAAISGPRTLTVGVRLTDSALASFADTAVIVVAAAVAYVDDTAVGLNNGTSWGDAYNDLQSALAMSAPGQVIRVGQGTYRPTTGTDRTASFVLPSGAEVYGGYAGNGAAEPDARDVALYPSVLSGDIGMVGNTADNSYHVVVANSATATAVLDGFTITAGKANGSFASFYDRGGGMYNNDSSLALSNCTFTANSANDSGGGMYNNSSFLTLTNCTFTANSGGYGGGLYNNSSSLTLTNCTFTANAVDWDSGGGMYNNASSSTLTNCIFTANSAGYGGGLYNYSSSPTLTNCTFVSNSAHNDGGGVFNRSSSPILSNCILWGNTADNGSQIGDNISTPVVTYCDIEEGYSGTGNITADPQFVRDSGPGPDGQWFTTDDDYGDLRLRPWSPAADAGTCAAVPASISTDLAGNPRFADVPTTVDSGVGTSPIVDMGAYEAVAALDVEAAGPYAVLEGRQVTLQGYGASAKAGTLLYEWDFDGDGQYGDAVGPTPTFSAATIRGPRTLTVGLRLTDSALASFTDTAVIVVAAAVAYVDDSATGLNNGTSWGDAYNDLQSALAMSAPGQTIRVGQGMYRPTTGTDRTASFVLPGGAKIYGGYAGNGATEPDARDVALYPSVLSGDIGMVGNTADNSYHVVVANSTIATVVLDGFTITAGMANGSSASFYDRGGGMYNNDSSLALSNCTFTANSANGSGGGMYNNSSSLTLTNCTFSANATTPGGRMFGVGMYNRSSSLTLTNCDFIANAANFFGGAIFGGGMCNASSSPALINCTFTGNAASGHNVCGGGMYNSSSSSPTLTNCTFTANIANSGGGMYNSYASFPTLINCTFAANSADIGGGMYNDASSPTLTNCVLWANTATSSSQIYDYSNTPTVTYCDVQGSYSGMGNINADPQFARKPDAGSDKKWRTADDDYGDLRLLLTSPCIDAGTNTAVPVGVTTDVVGNPRFVDLPSVANTGSGTAPIVDMGAYEYTTPLIAGTSGNDDFVLGLTPDHASMQVASPSGTNTYAIPTVTSLRFTGGMGGDRLILDFTNGNPVPAGGIVFDAGAAQEPGDSLIVQGTANGDSVVMNGNQVTVNGSVINSNGVEFFGFDLGEQGSGNLAGVSGLVKAGPGTLVLSGTNTYAGGTTVEGGKVVVTSANALPSGTNLTINGGSVVLDACLTQAVKVSGLRLNLGTRNKATAQPMPAAAATAPVDPGTQTTPVTIPAAECDQVAATADFLSVGISQSVLPISQEAEATALTPSATSAVCAALTRSVRSTESLALTRSVRSTSAISPLIRSIQARPTYVASWLKSTKIGLPTTKSVAKTAARLDGVKSQNAVQKAGKKLIVADAPPRTALFDQVFRRTRPLKKAVSTTQATDEVLATFRQWR